MKRAIILGLGLILFLVILGGAILMNLDDQSMFSDQDFRSETSL